MASAVTLPSSPPSDATISFSTLARTAGRVQIFSLSGSMRAPASSADSAVYGDDLTLDVARLLRDKEHGQRRDLLGATDASHRDPLSDPGGGHPDEGPAPVGLGHARR